VEIQWQIHFGIKKSTRKTQPMTNQRVSRYVYLTSLHAIKQTKESFGKNIPWLKKPMRYWWCDEQPPNVNDTEIS